MEQKLINRILIVGIVLGSVALIGGTVFAFTLHQRITTLELLGANNIQVSGSPVVTPDPVAVFAGFVGRPVSAIVINEDGDKVVELRGHVTESTNKAYENVPDTDTATRKIIIDTDTILRRVTEGGQIPMVSGIEFEQLSISTAPEVYVVSYETKEGEKVEETTPAHSVIIFAK